MFLVFIHNRLAIMSLLYFLLVALWGFFRFFRKQGPNSSYWGALAIAEILIVLQGLLGVYLWIRGGQPARGGMHFLYGALVPVMIPLVYAYTKGGEDRRDSLAYATAAILAVGLAMRALTTGIDVLPF